MAQGANALLLGRHRHARLRHPRQAEGVVTRHYLAAHGSRDIDGASAPMDSRRSAPCWTAHQADRCRTRRLRGPEHERPRRAGAPGTGANLIRLGETGARQLARVVRLIPASPAPRIESVRVSSAIWEAEGRLEQLGRDTGERNGLADIASGLNRRRKGHEIGARTNPLRRLVGLVGPSSVPVASLEVATPRRRTLCGAARCSPNTAVRDWAREWGARAVRRSTRETSGCSSLA